MRLMSLFDRLAFSRVHVHNLQWHRAAHARMDAAVPDGAVLFLGDSHTCMLVTAAVAPNSVNFGINGLTSEQLLENMPIYRSMERARAVCIMVGTNDLLSGHAEGLKQRYAAILAQVPARVPVIFCSVPPLTNRPERGFPDVDQKARAAALALRDVCAEDRRCRFVDVHALLDDAPGTLTADGVHLSEAGCAVWIEALRSALAQG